LTDLDVADAGDCTDRARARPLCLQAMTQRCRSQSTACEAACETQFGSMPGNTEKEPAVRGEMEVGQCRQRCNSGLSPCLRALLGRCPELCP
jgi:hypothetical protein